MEGHKNIPFTPNSHVNYIPYKQSNQETSGFASLVNQLKPCLVNNSLKKKNKLNDKKVKFSSLFQNNESLVLKETPDNSDFINNTEDLANIEDNKTDLNNNFVISLTSRSPYSVNYCNRNSKSKTSLFAEYASISKSFKNDYLEKEDIMERKCCYSVLNQNNSSVNEDDNEFYFDNKKKPKDTTSLSFKVTSKNSKFRSSSNYNFNEKIITKSFESSKYLLNVNRNIINKNNNENNNLDLDAEYDKDNDKPGKSGMMIERSEVNMSEMSTDECDNRKFSNQSDFTVYKVDDNKDSYCNSCFYNNNSNNDNINNNKTTIKLIGSNSIISDFSESLRSKDSDSSLNSSNSSISDFDENEYRREMLIEIDTQTSLNNNIIEFDKEESSNSQCETNTSNDFDNCLVNYGNSQLINWSLVNDHLMSSIYSDDIVEEYVENTLTIIAHFQDYFNSESFLREKEHNQIKSINNLTEIVNMKVLADYTMEAKKLNNPTNTTVSATKNILVLDMDETLLHCNSPTSKSKDYNHIINFTDSEEDLGISVRPNLENFLLKASKNFNLVLYSAGSRDYIDIVLNKLNLKDYFYLVLSNSECINLNNSIFLKNLDLVKKLDCIFFGNDCFDEEREVIIADNNLFSFANHLRNGILVSCFTFNKEDDGLNDLNEYLDELVDNKENINVRFEVAIENQFYFDSLMKAIRDNNEQ